MARSSSAAISDPTERLLRQLDRALQPVAFELVDAARAAGVPLIITSARRSLAEQRQLLAAGRTRTLRSAHLAGLAFDVDIYRVAREAVPLWFWQALGPFGESLGLRWGGRFSGLWDPGHFELRRPP